jgi:hypothetical protein
MTTDPLYNKLQFSGFCVTFYNHESRIIEHQNFPTVESVLARKFTLAEFPSAEDFAEDLFNVYGDCVGKVTDNAGNVLFDNMDEMNDLYESMNNYP